MQNMHYRAKSPTPYKLTEYILNDKKKVVCISQDKVSMAGWL